MDCCVGNGYVVKTQSENSDGSRGALVIPQVRARGRAGQRGAREGGGEKEGVLGFIY